MSDLAEYTTKTSKTAEAIYRIYEERSNAEPTRNYLGASIIGHEC